MFIRKAAPALTRRVVLRPAITRSFVTSITRSQSQDAHKSQDASPKPGQSSKLMKPFEDITDEHDLLPPGANPGTIPTDLEQATGLERLEILGKMQGVDIFDMTPLDASRKGTFDKPIVVNGFGPEQYIGCTGSPADSHVVIWLVASRDRPFERCPECGSVYRYDYVGPVDDPHHGHEHAEHERPGGEHEHGYGHHHADTDGSHNIAGEPKTIADYVRAEYR